MEPSSTTPAAGARQDVSAPSAERRILVHSAVMVVAALFIGMVSVLYYFSWWKPGPRAPTSLLVVEGNAQIGDAEVIVEGPTKIFEGKLLAKEAYICRFHLVPAVYTVRVERQGVPVVSKTVQIADRHYVPVKISASPKPPGGTP